MDELTDRDRAILWAREILEAYFVVLDTETTGLGGDAEACQIGIVSKAGEVLLDQLVKPKRPIPDDAVRLHGITNEAVKAMPAFDAVLPELDVLLQNTVLVYNADYDQRILAQSARAREVSWDTQSRWHCVMEWFAQFYGDWNDYHGSYRWQKLTTAVRVLNIQIEAAHSAVGDALMTLKVVEGMAKSKLSTEE